MKDIIKSIKDDCNKGLILTHHNADIDAVASSIVLHELLNNKIEVCVPDNISKSAKDIASGYSFKKNPNLNEYDCLIVLDCPSPKQLEPLNLKRFTGKIIAIDHHGLGKLHKMADETIIDTDAVSTTEVLYKIIKNNNHKLNANIAEYIIYGIVADSAHLSHAKSRHFKYLSTLLETTSKSYNQILNQLRTPISYSEKIARLKASKRIDIHQIDEYIVVTSHISSFEASAARSLIKLGADIAIVAAPRSNETRISARCKRKLTSDLHLADDIFKPIEDTIEGTIGGHDTAASLNSDNSNYKDLIQKIVELLKEKLNDTSKENQL